MLHQYRAEIIVCLISFLTIILDYEVIFYKYMNKIKLIYHKTIKFTFLFVFILQ